MNNDVNKQFTEKETQMVKTHEKTHLTKGIIREIQMRPWKPFQTDHMSNNLKVQKH